MKKIFFLLFFTLLFRNLYCQEAAIDSLKSIIAKPANDTALVNAWVDLDNLIYLSDPALDEELNKKILDFSEKKLKTELDKSLLFYYKSKQLIGLNNLGIINMYRSDNEKAKKFFDQFIVLAKELGNKQKIAAAYNNFGVLYYRQGNLIKSIEYYTKALTMTETAGDYKAMAAAMNNIGGIYKEMGDTPKALNMFRKSLAVGEKAGLNTWKAVSLSAIGEIYSELGKSDSAEILFKESLKIDLEIGNIQGVASCLANLSKFNLIKGNLELAKQKADSALTIFREIKDIRAEGLTLNILGTYYSQKGDLSNALICNKKALELLMPIGQIQEAEKAAEALYKIYKKQSDYKNAFEMKELYDRLHDTLQNEENTKAIIRQEFKYEYDKQTAIDSLKHVAEIDKKDAELKVKRQVQVTLVVGLLLILIFAGFIFNRFRVTARQNSIIESQKTVVEQKNREIVDSINYAKRLQDAILPPDKLVKEYFRESFIIYKPKDIVAGDFYWFEKKNDSILFAAADCTGHGVPGAMVSVICNNGLNRSVREYGLLNPGEILDKTREIVIQEFEKSETEVKDGMDISLCSLKGNKLSWSGANNPLWILRGEEFIEYKPNKQPIGKHSEQTNFTTHTIDLKKGDTIYLFTDGFADQFGGEKGKKFKTSNMRILLMSLQNNTMQQQKEIINSTFEDWKGSFDQVDDVCMIGIRV